MYLSIYTNYTDYNENFGDIFNFHTKNTAFCDSKILTKYEDKISCEFLRMFCRVFVLIVKHIRP